jgi:HD-GYP domain-containing protein (c-di-GMP phosphodiesterase class II)
MEKKACIFGKIIPKCRHGVDLKRIPQVTQGNILGTLPMKITSIEMRLGDEQSIRPAHAITEEQLHLRHLSVPLNARIETEAWLSLAESVNDGGPVTHSTRVGLLAARLGFELGLSRSAVAALDLGARLHDIGKLFISEEILLSPGKLSDESRALMQTHTVRGAELLSRASSPTVRLAAQVARHHHERWDGTGYPDRLKGDEIPLVARITALADVYDALRHERSYKSAWSHEAAVREITAGRGTHFDPELTDIFLQMLESEISGSEPHLYATDALVTCSRSAARCRHASAPASRRRGGAPRTRAAQASA